MSATDPERDPGDLEPESITSKTLVELTRSLAALLTAGLPLARALETTRDIAGGNAAPILDGVLTDVRRGRSLAEALRGYPLVFSPMYVGVVRAGERSGRLAAIVERLADELERQEELRQRLISAAVYPAALVGLGVCSIVLLLLFVVPRFAELLVDAGATLPATTAALLSASTLLRANWLYLLLVALVSIVAAASYTSSVQGRRAVSAGLIRVPIVGAIVRSALAVRFARILAVLLEGGAPLIAALSDTAESVADPSAEDEVLRIREDVRTGSSLTASLGQGELFPVELTRLVAVGEESGRLAEFLGRGSDLLERRVTRATERAVTLLEPAVIVLFGGIVAVVALALLQAIYGVNAGAFR